MDTSKLKSFAPQARVRLQEQIGAKLDYVLRGDSAELRGKSGQVESIRKASEAEGRTQYIERIAYTWFNRLSALPFIISAKLVSCAARSSMSRPYRFFPRISCGTSRCR